MMTAEEMEGATAEDFLTGKLLLVDKPLTWSSFDVVKKIRYNIQKKFGLKKLKVGHAGTLDPLATGLLILCTGKFTKKITELTLAGKSYTGTFMLGATTPSFDLETRPDQIRSTEGVTPEKIAEAAAELAGISQQVPPQFSAKLVEGKRAYLSARKGETVELKSREVNISKFEVSSEHFPEVYFEIDCSTGTYIRSIARDLGEALGCGAHLTSLRRTAVGDYRAENSLTVDQVIAALDAQP
ncbi:MAG: tRNA pseudouridine(55) synthase TruB [Flavobacteriales bacterium]|nr:tRNA pseudouridine(55) synthase TruB [Flavobacteriales bacterium]